jgi:tRNA(Ile)-lysidine synthase
LPPAEPITAEPIAAGSMAAGAGPREAGSEESTFAGLMARLGPFERHPDIAVAVSGGPDSMALALLLAEWTAERGGRLFAVTVDHRLRPESAAEARQVGAWLAGRAHVAHHILEWTGPKPRSGLQHAARMARYALLADFCRAKGILHLCLAHQRDDQWETHSMRAARGGAGHGLSAMSAIRPWRGVRILRPLLSVPKRLLVEFLQRREQPWIEDPSNRNRAFERVRQREKHGEADSRSQAALLAIQRAGQARQDAEHAAAELLARSLTVDAHGFAWLDPEFARGAEPSALTALGWVLQSIGGADYAPPLARRRDALAMFRRGDWPGFTLGGCQIIEKAGGNARRILLCRDWGAIRDRRSVDPGDCIPPARIHWDRRFDITLSPDLPRGRAYVVARLGERGVQWLGRNRHSLAGHPLPEPVRKGLPALWVGHEPVAVPQLGFGAGMTARFRPHQPVTSCGFTVAY